MTAIEKWADEWFQDLTPIQKLLFLYMCDNCDCAGVWDKNLSLAAFQIGTDKSTIEGALQGLASRVIQVGNKLWLTRFLKHQKNLPLNLDNPAHRGIYKTICLHTELADIIFENIGFQYDKKGLQCPIGKGKGKGVGKDKGISNNNSETLKKNEPIAPDFPSVEAACKMAGLTPEETKLFFSHYQSQGWMKSNGLPVTDLNAKIVNWRLNQHKFAGGK